ncbi:ABC-2 type transport system ATP-binding protein [Gracilibacillus ureilyticus]|uniref:ABC-2 type transport system ATP-binding protein n=1 Tax=Gracilibacillus ureilyticus TaxID=531814 RepID=A0A1H9QE81_9BACI|nr:ABC transporter ATP-binding protein [Gracilibacillus ureilyticus]SER58189.1 ABC-2 type transport system ATP-binding protein [Gracilibacillus ureilyticus]
MAVIKVQGLKKKFKGAEIIKGLDFQLETGRCVALLGPNGAGKTTTLRILSGLLKPTDGTVLFEGREKNRDIRHFIGYLPQYPVFHSWMSGKEFLVYVGMLAHLPKKEAGERAEKLLKKVDIYEAGNRKIASYSGGMRQRLGIAQAMIHQPQLLLLDEPVSALDPIGRREVLTLMEELKEQTTILFSTHILGDAEEICDDLLLLHKGKIVEKGAIEELRNKNQSAKFELKFSSNSLTYFERIKSMDIVQDCLMVKSEIHVQVKDIEKARQQILAASIKNNWPLVKFELSRTSLEDLFMKVVKN